MWLAAGLVVGMTILILLVGYLIFKRRPHWTFLPRAFLMLGLVFVADLLLLWLLPQVGYQPVFTQWSWVDILLVSAVWIALSLWMIHRRERRPPELEQRS